jgi:hypothetical protein
LYSVLITSIHHHEDLTSRKDCAICKAAKDFQSADKGFHPLTVIFNLPLSLASGGFVYVTRALTADQINRAPPVYLPSQLVALYDSARPMLQGSLKRRR